MSTSGAAVAGYLTQTALDARYAASSLRRWHAKLSADPTNAKITLMGDSTSDPTTDSVAILNRLKDAHTLPGEGLEGMVKANIVSYGHNGSKRSEWAANPAWKAEVVNSAPDLIIYSYGINDRRLGLATVADITAGIISDIDYLRGELPTTDFVLRVPNSFLSDDPGATGWIAPPGSSQQYSDDLRMIYSSLAGRWPNVVIWNAQDRVFGRTSKPLASSLGLMKDILHPSKENGYPLIADRLVTDLIGHPRLAPATAPKPVDMHQAAAPAYPYLFGDLGDRPDSTTAIGASTSGLAPTVSGGPAGIISGAIYVPTGALANIRWDIGSTNYELGTTLVKRDGSSLNTHFILAWLDSSNFIYLKTASGARYELVKLVGGSNTFVKTVVMTASDGDRLTARRQDNVYSIFVNDQLIINETVTEHATATSFGFQISDAIVRYKYTWARRIVAR